MEIFTLVIIALIFSQKNGCKRFVPGSIEYKICEHQIKIVQLIENDDDLKKHYKRIKDIINSKIADKKMYFELQKYFEDEYNEKEIIAYENDLQTNEKFIDQIQKLFDDQKKNNVLNPKEVGKILLMLTQEFYERNNIYREKQLLDALDKLEAIQQENERLLKTLQENGIDNMLFPNL